MDTALKLEMARGRIEEHIRECNVRIKIKTEMVDKRPIDQDAQDALDREINFRDGLARALQHMNEAGLW